MSFRSVFADISSYAHRWPKRGRINRQGRPDTVIEAWARSVQCVARGVCSEIFSAGVGKTISRAVSVRRCFVFCLSNVGVFAHTYLVENGTARHNSVCNTHDTFSRKKKEAAGPNRLGATLSLRTRVRDPASVRFAFFFFRLAFLCSFFSFVLNVGVS